MRCSRKGALQSGREDGVPVLLSLALPHDDLSEFEVDVLHSQLKHLQQAQAASIKKGSGEGRGAVHALQDRRDFLLRQDDRHVLGELGPFRPRQAREFPAEDVPVQKQDSAERLILGGSRDAEPRGDGFEEGLDLGLRHGVRVALAAEHDEAADPEDVRLLCARRVVA